MSRLSNRGVFTAHAGLALSVDSAKGLLDWREAEGVILKKLQQSGQYVTWLKTSNELVGEVLQRHTEQIALKLQRDAFAQHPLNHMTPTARGLVFQRVVQEVDLLSHPGGKILDPLMSPPEDYARLCELKPEAATNIQAGLEMGLEQLQREAGAAPPQRGFLDWLRGAAPQDEAADVEQASSMAILLSDGQPNGGISDKQGLLSLASRLCPSEVTMHAFGFTQSHDIDLMSALPSKSSGKPGSYYYLGSAQDIGAAVGDALGAVSWQPCRNLQLRVEGPTGGGWYGPPDANAEEDAPLLGLQESRSLVALGAKERQILLYAMPENTSLPPAVTLRLTWSTEQEGEQSYEAQLLLEKLDTSASSALSALAVRAHVLRFQVAHALTALAVSPAAHERFAHVHQAVLDGLISLQALEDQEEDQEAIFLEGMLQALERDLGEALASQDRSSERKGVLLSFAAEHFGMHSASSLTRLRTTYASQQQIQTRLRFLQSTKPGAVDAKAGLDSSVDLGRVAMAAAKRSMDDKPSLPGLLSILELAAEACAERKRKALKVSESEDSSPWQRIPTSSDSEDSGDSGATEESGSVLTSRISEEQDGDAEAEELEPLEPLDFDQVTLMDPARVYFRGSHINARLFSPPNQRAKFLS
ncbi:Ca-activated chloride channel homolog [Durusdinium trenchii]|uniref:Ca-activated chloride channel homolog n=1 Tax=Durusdinium trenchii TaxID=1381693 RepID=A0ABP0LNM4_9DINO